MAMNARALVEPAKFVVIINSQVTPCMKKPTVNFGTLVNVRLRYLLFSHIFELFFTAR